MDQNSQNNVLINNSRTAWPTYILRIFLIPWTIYYKMFILFFQKKGIDNFNNRTQNMLIFGKCHTPSVLQVD